MDAPSLFDQLGGSPTVEKFVESFMEKILSDNDINIFFSGVDVEKTKRHLRAFVTLALGGPNWYTGKELRSNHARFQLKDWHYDRVIQYIDNTMSELGANRSQILTALATFEILRFDILNK